MRPRHRAYWRQAASFWRAIPDARRLAAAKAQLGFVELGERGLKVLEKVRIAQVDHEQRGICVPDDLIKPGLREVGMDGRQVHKLHLNVFELHHARQRDAEW